MRKPPTKTRKRRRKKKLGKTQRKVLLLLLSGIALGLSGSPKHYFKIVGETKRAWREIDNPNGRRSIRTLHNAKILKEEKQRDGAVALVLSQQGKRIAREADIDAITLPRRKHIVWDGKWRLVLFDIPEKRRDDRDLLRHHLKRLGFIEVQKSAFAFPFSCLDEIQTIINFYKLKQHVKLIVADAVSDDQSMKESFKIRIRNPK